MLQNVEEVTEALLSGQVAAGARAIRWLDDRDPRGFEVLEKIFLHTGQAHVVGITGPPGAGKSTLVSMLAGEWRKRGKRVGVLAVDPTSPFSGGAILGDRLRMKRHSTDPGVFIRSLGSRGGAGGLSTATQDCVTIFDAMGYDIVVVETVGVGQEEMEIVRLAHSTMIISVPGLGDEIQAMKAGLFETGDIFVLNKADREGAADLKRQLMMLLHLRESHEGTGDRWSPPLLQAVAVKDEGGEEIVTALEEHADWLREQGGFDERRAVRNQHVFLSLVREEMEERLQHAARELLIDIRKEKVDPYQAAKQMIERLPLS